MTCFCTFIVPLPDKLVKFYVRNTAYYPPLYFRGYISACDAAKPEYSGIARKQHMDLKEKSYVDAK